MAIFPSKRLCAFVASPVVTKRSCVRVIGNIAIEGGGGIGNAWGSVVVAKDAIIEGNLAMQADVGAGGGGFRNSEDASSFLYNTVFRRNSAFIGGGLMNAMPRGKQFMQSNVVLEHVSFEHNFADTDGGGAFFYLHPARLTHVSFTNNTARTGAGAVFEGGTVATVRACSFTANKALLNGGGMSVNSKDTNVHVFSTTFERNRAFHQGAGIYLSGPASLTLNSSFVASCIAGTHGGGTYVMAVSNVYLCVCVCVILYIHIQYIYIQYTYIYIYNIYMYMYIQYIYIYKTYVHICILLCMYSVHTHTHTHTHTDTLTHTRTQACAAAVPRFWRSRMIIRSVDVRRSRAWAGGCWWEVKA